jgi:hypothetical protein
MWGNRPTRPDAAPAHAVARTKGGRALTFADIAYYLLLSLAVLVVVATIPVMLFALDWMCWRAYGDGEGWYAADQWATEQLPVLADDDRRPSGGGFDVGFLDFFGDFGGG